MNERWLMTDHRQSADSRTGSAYSTDRLPGRFAALIALLLMVGACGGGREAPVGEDTRSATRFLIGEGGPGFAQVTGPRPFVVPDDYGAHPDYRIEWWYFTGNLFTEQDRHFGFELTFFRLALAADQPQRLSHWGTRQAWMAHFALTDTHNRQFFAAERFGRGALGIAGARAQPFRVHVRDWQAASEGDELFPLQLRATTDELALDLALDAIKPMIGHGEDGFDPKGPEPGNASAYYSFTRLATRGTVRQHDATYDVTGLAWMDREWSTSVLSPDIDGWDWFSIQLQDGRDIMYYRLRHTDGTASDFSGGTLVLADGSTLALSAVDVVLDETRHWRSPVSGIRYPVAWQLTLPAHDMTLNVEAVMDAQEMNLSVRYWEGAVRITGSDPSGTLSGYGYTELAGY
jgi:predicted secreted hydrolase